MSRLFVIALLIGVLGAIMASMKGRNPIVWFILGMAAPISLVVLLFLPSVNQRLVRTCPHCGRPIGERDTECSQCGRSTPVSINMVKCRSCGMMVPEESLCSNCGKSL